MLSVAPFSSKATPKSTAHTPCCSMLDLSVDPCLPGVLSSSFRRRPAQPTHPCVFSQLAVLLSCAIFFNCSCCTHCPHFGGKKRKSSADLSPCTRMRRVPLPSMDEGSIWIFSCNVHTFPYCCWSPLPEPWPHKKITCAAHRCTPTNQLTHFPHSPTYELTHDNTVAPAPCSMPHATEQDG